MSGLPANKSLGRARSAPAAALRAAGAAVHRLAQIRQESLTPATRSVGAPGRVLAFCSMEDAGQATLHMRRSDGRRLLQLGITLFLLGLLTGLAVPALANPRMALASHIEAVMNGTFLVLLGLVWPALVLSPRLLNAAFWLAVYGAFTNWIATLLAAAWRAGNPMMPIAAQGSVGSPTQELVLRALLVSLALAMISACVLVLIGLRGPAARPDDGQA